MKTPVKKKDTCRKVAFFFAVNTHERSTEFSQQDGLQVFEYFLAT